MSGKSRSIRSVKKSLQNTGPMLPGMETLETAEDIISPQLMSYAGAFHANHTVSQEKDKQAQMTGIFGENFTGSFANLDHDGSWLKTYRGYCQVRMDGSLEELSGTWPRSGIAQNGHAYELQTSERLTNGKEFSLWPTPTAQDGKNATCPPSQKNRDTLPGSMWRTPQHADSKSSKIQAGHTTNLTHQVRGNLNPEWVETLMGFPPGWTDLSDGLRGLESDNTTGNLLESSLESNQTEQSA